jgi:hypothetical protein
MCAAVVPSFFADINGSGERKKKYLIFVFALIALVSSLRGIGVGIDTRQFANAYTEIGYLDWSGAFAMRYEPGFITLCKLLNYFSGNYQLLLIVSSCFILFSFARFIYRNCEDVVMGTYVFLCMPFAQSLNQMRQYIAVCILLFAIELLKEKRYLKFLLLVLLAASFHYSAIICVVFIVLYKTVLSKKLIPLLPFAGIILAFILTNYRNILSAVVQLQMFNQYSGYIGGRMDVQDTVTRPLKLLLIALVLIFLVLAMKNKNTEEGLKYNFTVNMLFMWGFVEMFSINIIIVSRFILYFDFIIISSVSKALHQTREKHIRIILIIVIYAAMFGYFYVSRIQRSSGGIIPYRFFWEV